MGTSECKCPYFKASVCFFAAGPVPFWRYYCLPFVNGLARTLVMLGDAPTLG